MIHSSEQETILKDFPNIKLSYENIAYKKVYNYDILLAIPHGKKCFAWFTTINDKNVCIIMEITDNKQIINMKVTNACFSTELCYGTILYGTVFNYKYNQFFTIEDVFYVKGENVEKECWGNKFRLITNMLKNDFKQISYNNSFIVFGSALISNNRNDLIHKINNVSYKIDCIQFRSYNRMNNFQILKLSAFMDPTFIDPNNLGTEKRVEKTINTTNTTNAKNTKKIEKVVPIPTKNICNSKVVFKIRPDIQNDIYHLYCLNEHLKEEYYNLAHIPDYKTSVFMNGLFRNIKENINLDALEESDDEEEFENEREDKFVYLEKEYNIVCSYNYKFKKWTPIKLADTSCKIVFKRDLPILA